MLGFSTHILRTGDVLSVGVPANLFLFIIFLIPLPVWIGAYRMTKTRRGRRTGILLVLANILILGAIFSPARVTLDGKSGTAKITNVLFFIPRHHIVPLSSVQGAMIKTSDLTEALTLVLNDGHSIQLTPFTQISGTDVAVAAINDFLREHGASG